MNNIVKPKRRRDKDNLYSLLYNDECEIKLIVNGKAEIIKVSEEIYEELIRNKSSIIA